MDSNYDMIIERDVPIPMDDGLVLRADVFRPKDGKPAPVIMTLGPYGKGAPYRVQFAPQWKWLITTSILSALLVSFMSVVVEAVVSPPKITQ